MFFLIYKLGAGSIVLGGDSRNLFSPGLSDRHDIEHEAERVVVVDGLRQIEDFGSMVSHDRGGEGAESLPELDFGIDDLLHFGISGIGQDAAVTESPGAPFESALEPADDAAARDSGGDVIDEFGFGKVLVFSLE